MKTPIATPTRVDISNKLFLIKLFNLKFLFGFECSSKLCASTEIGAILSLTRTETFMIETMVKLFSQLNFFVFEPVRILLII